MFRSIAILAAVLLIGSVAAQAADKAIGVVKKAEGAVSLERHGESLAVKTGTKVAEKDVVQTGGDGSVGIIFSDDTLLSLGPDSRLVLEEYAFEPAEGKFAFWTRLSRGTAAYLSGKIVKLAPEAVKVQTPNAMVGVRGTKFAVQVD